MKEPRPLISIVTPVYREAANIERFFERASAAVKDRDFDVEFIFVNDGSPDDSLAILRRLAATDSRVRVISFIRNFGAIAGYTAGARHSSGDAAVLIASDLQDPPELIPQMVERWRQGHDVVWAVRDGRDDPWLKTALAQSFYAVVRLLVFPDYPRGGTDVFLMSRRALDVFHSLPERDSSPFFAVYAYGFPEARIPYRRGPRTAGESGWPFWKRVKNAIDVITSFSYAPLRLISATGFVFAILAFLAGLIIAYRRLVLDLGTEGWPSLAVLILFIGGVQIMFLGILAEYLWRIAEQSRQRPRYIIGERIGSWPPIERRKLDPLDLDVSAPPTH